MRPASRRSCLLLLLLVGGGFGSPVGAQEEAPPPILRGEVVLGGEGVPDVQVVLHRVSPLEAGEVDSLRTDGVGSFAFRLDAWPDPGRAAQVHFASVRYQEILYFGPPVAQPVQLDSVYRIEVFPARPAWGDRGRDSVVVEVRNVFLEGREEGGWQVTDVFRVRNDGGATLVASDRGETWGYPLPAGATDFQVGQSDLAPDAVTFPEGRLRVSAPIPPGDRIYVIRYALQAADVTLDLPGTTEVLEMLIREPAPALDVTGLTPQGVMELDPGSAYRVFAAEGLEDSQVTVEEGEEGLRLPVREMMVFLGLLLAGLGVFLVRRKDQGAPDPDHRADVTPVETERAAVLLAVARLDQEFEQGSDRSSEDAAEYHHRRKELLSRLPPTGA